MIDCLLRLFRPAAALAVLFFAAPASAQLVINEVDYDQGATDAAEFIEIRNNGAAPVNVDGFTLELDDGTLYDTITLQNVEVAAGGYYVVCGDSAQVASCDQDVTPDTEFITDGAGGGIGLKDAGGTLLDALSYEGDNATFIETTGVGVEDDGTVAAAGISRVPDGADTDDNSADFELSCSTPGAANVSASSNCLCGDGAIDAGEECDEGEQNGTAASCCEIDCQFKGLGATCGDPTDTDCDAADTCDGSGSCSANVAADGTPCTDDGAFCNGAESCLGGTCESAGNPCDPDHETCDEEDDVCVRPACGDGVIEGEEECDDFNFEPGDGCDQCEIEPGWACGDADDDGVSDCFETCGDGTVDEFESCDDGDVEGGDGCSESCQIEAGWECTSGDGGDLCRPVCGDGFTRPGEDCDDGNSVAGDGCSECQVESGYLCDRQSPSVCVIEDAAGGCRAAGRDGAAPLAILLLAAALVLRRRRT